MTALVPDTLLKNAEEPLPSLNYFTYGSVQLQQYDNYGDVFHDLTTRLEFMLSNCASVMSNRTLVERLRDQKYNLLLGDSSDLCIQLLSQKLTAPYVAYDSAGAFSLTQGILSQMQYPLVTIPAYGSGLAGGIGGPMPIKDRLKNVVQHVR